LGTEVLPDCVVLCPPGGPHRTILAIRWMLLLDVNCCDSMKCVDSVFLTASKILDTPNFSSKNHDPADQTRSVWPERFLLAIEQSSCVDEFLASVLPVLCDDFSAQSVGLVQQNHGQWVKRGWSGEEQELPESLVPRAMDQEKCLIERQWITLPLSERRGSEVLIAQGGPSFPPSALIFFRKSRSWESDSGLIAAAEQIALNLGVACHHLEQATYSLRRVSQLTAILEAAAQWQRYEDDQSLLEAIAGTATTLLDCDRASIFLWDRKRKKLIGQPALGVPGGTLEVDDSAGVVGEVLQSESPKIWNNGNDEESRVNREVDRNLEFQTHSLVAVPMFDQRNRIIGVFEAINHVESLFEQSHAVVLGDLARHAAVAIQSQKVRRALTLTRDRLVDDAAASSPLIGNHPTMLAIKETARKVAATDLGVLIRGGNGTGKEVLARTIHFESHRRAGPFIAVNCAALVETLLESELFGHEKGSFTDAQSTRVGKFELADQGTLFLDEIGDMSPGGQAKLLRVLEEKVVVRVGGSQTIPVDVRVLAATNQPLEELIRQKRFREDLFFRLNVVNLTLPELRERGEDILVLAEHFLAQFCAQIGRRVPTFQIAAQQSLLSYAWPGNIRELRNTIERVAYLCSDDEISAGDLMLTPSSLSSASVNRPAIEGTLNDATREFQVDHIRRAIEACGGKMTEAAKRLGVHRSNLYRKMQQLGMPTTEEIQD